MPPPPPPIHPDNAPRPAALDAPPRLAVGPARVPGIGRVWGTWLHLAIFGVTLLYLAVAVALLLPFVYTFWVLLEVAYRAWDLDRRLSWGAAVIIGTLAAWSLLFLGTDRTALLGNRRAQRLLLEKAQRLLPLPLPERRFFVEAQATAARRGFFRLNHDLGWLFFYADHLVFVGDTQTATLPRAAVSGSITRDRNSFRLSAAFLSLGLREPAGKTVRLLCRQDVSRLSETHARLPALEAALREWLDADEGI